MAENSMNNPRTIFGMPTEIVAGVGACAKLPEYLTPGENTLLVTDRGIADTDIAKKVTAVLQDAGFPLTTFSDVSPNPDEKTVENLTAFIRENKIRQAVALGGGSPLDAAKAACAMATNDGPLEDYQWNNKPFENPALPLIAVPTTAGTGSEVTGVAVITSRNAKKGIKKREIFPKTAILDPELMLTMPPFLTATTGMDALTHAIEAYVGKNVNPMTDSLAEASVRLIGDNLAKAVENGSDIETRSNMALASTMAGIAMDQAGLGIVHSLSSPVCTFMHLSHGLANAILIPFGMEYNLASRPERFAKIAQLLGESTSDRFQADAARLSVELVYRLIERIGLGEELTSVKNQFKKRDDLETFGESASNIFLIRNNPKPASAAECTEIFRRIAEG